MTSATVTPINDKRHSDPRGSDEFAELLATLADLAVKARNQRERLARQTPAGDARVRDALEHLADLERHARDVGAEAARVRHELQHARLI